jgi:hypothetical protein
MPSFLDHIDTHRSSAVEWCCTSTVRAAAAAAAAAAETFGGFGKHSTQWVSCDALNGSLRMPCTHVRACVRSLERAEASG